MDIFSALADPTRRHIVEMLASQGKLSSTTISDKFHISAPAISQHLKVLRESDLVSVEKQAQQRIYGINLAKMDELQEWVSHLKKEWNSRFDRLDDVLARELKKSQKNHT